MVEKLRTVEQIKDAVKKVAEKENPLYQRMEDDYGLSRGERHKVAEGYESYTDNRPQTLNHSIGVALDTAELTLQIPIVKQKEPKRREQSETERFVYGCIDRANLNREQRDEPDLQSEMSWYARNRGCIVAIPLVYKAEDQDGATDVEIILWDRRWTRYSKSKKGFRWIACERKMSSAQVLEEYGFDTEQDADTKDDIDVIEFWDEEMNGLIVGEAFAKALTPHQIGYCPGIVKSVGGTPTITSTKFDDTVKDRGESIYAPNRLLYPIRNDLLSAYKTMVARGMKGSYKVFSTDGTLTLEEDPGKLGTPVPLAKQRDEDIEPLESLVMPADAMAVLGASDVAIQEGGPMLAQINQPMGTQSGLALEVRNYPFRGVVNSPKQAMESAFAQIAYSLTRQFSANGDEKNLGLEPLELRVNDREAKEVKLIKFSPDKIKPERFEAKLEVEYITDRMQKWMIAEIAQRTGLSLETIMEEILNLPDIDLEHDKKLVEMAHQNPIIITRMMAQALMERGYPKMAFQLVMENMQLQAQREQEFMQTMTMGQQGMAPQQQGMVSPMKTPQAPNVPPNPAQDEQMKLQQMGLLGPRGI